METDEILKAVQGMQEAVERASTLLMFQQLIVVTLLGAILGTLLRMARRG